VKGVVLDASAVMTLFEGRPGAAKVGELLNDGLGGKTVLLMSVVNWGEVYYSMWRRKGLETANDALDKIARMPIEIVGADGPLTKIAAEIRAQHKLPYADCFAAALARQRVAAIATADRDFALIEDMVEIYWTV
jgi:predicted nucleic acid-binding protein